MAAYRPAKKQSNDQENKDVQIVVCINYAEIMHKLCKYFYGALSPKKKLGKDRNDPKGLLDPMTQRVRWTLCDDKNWSKEMVKYERI